MSTLLNSARRTGCVHEDRGADGQVATGTPGAATGVASKRNRGMESGRKDRPDDILALTLTPPLTYPNRLTCDPVPM
jgi:hypothetical protein